MSVTMDYRATLLNYESSELIRLRSKAVHGRELNAGGANEIAASFRQARNYHEAFQTSDRSVRPLLMYYAILGYSRALTLFLQPGLREAGLAQSHGLSVNEWQNVLSQNNADLGNLSIIINANGTFRQLIESTNHESFLRSNSSKPNVVHSNAMPAANCAVTLGDLLARLPEVRETFLRWKDVRRSVAIWPQGPTADGRTEIRVDPPYDDSDWRAVFDDLEITGGPIFTGKVPSGQTAWCSDVTGVWNVGTIVAMRTYPGNIQLSKIATAFVVAYAIGMLVRYYPSHWMGMLHGHRSDAALPTLLAALEHISEDYPRFVVEFLEGRPKTT